MIGGSKQWLDLSSAQAGKMKNTGRDGAGEADDQFVRVGTLTRPTGARMVQD